LMMASLLNVFSNFRICNSLSMFIHCSLAARIAAFLRQFFKRRFKIIKHFLDPISISFMEWQSTKNTTSKTGGRTRGGCLRDRVQRWSLYIGSKEELGQLLDAALSSHPDLKSLELAIMATMGSALVPSTFVARKIYDMLTTRILLMKLQIVILALILISALVTSIVEGICKSSSICTDECK
jgi:hypothetical protein